MNTQHLQYIIEIERTRSISQAAENLFMAQPNLSKAIKELEETLVLGEEFGISASAFEKEGLPLFEAAGVPVEREG